MSQRGDVVIRLPETTLYGVLGRNITFQRFQWYLPLSLTITRSSGDRLLTMSLPRSHFRYEQVIVRISGLQSPAES